MSRNYRSLIFSEIFHAEAEGIKRNGDNLKADKDDKSDKTVFLDQPLTDSWVIVVFIVDIGDALLKNKTMTIGLYIV